MSQTNPRDLWKSDRTIDFPNCTSELRAFKDRINIKFSREEEISLSNEQLDRILQEREISPREYAQAYLNGKLNNLQDWNSLLEGKNKEILLVDSDAPDILIITTKNEAKSWGETISPRQFARGRSIAKNLQNGDRLVCKVSSCFGDDWIVENRTGKFYVDCKNGREEKKKLALWECEKYFPSKHFPLYLKGDKVEGEVMGKGLQVLTVNEVTETKMLVLQPPQGSEINLPICNVFPVCSGAGENRRGLALICENGLPETNDLDTLCEKWEISESVLRNAITDYKKHFCEPADELPQFKVGDRVKMLLSKNHYLSGKTGVIQKIIEGERATVLPDTHTPKFNNTQTLHFNNLEPTDEIIPTGTPQPDIVAELEKKLGSFFELDDGEEPATPIAVDRSHEEHSDPPSPFEIEELVSWSEAPGAIYRVVSFKAGHATIEISDRGGNPKSKHYPHRRCLPFYEIKKIEPEEVAELRLDSNIVKFPSVTEEVTVTNQQLALSKAEVPTTLQQAQGNANNPIEAKISDDFTTLTGCEKILDRLDEASLEAGRALHAIKFNLDDNGNPLFKAKEKTWKKYCESTGRDRRTCDEYIQAWEVSQRVVIPDGAKICAIRSWLKLDRVKEKHQQKVINRAAEFSSSITAKVIADTIAGLAEIIEDLYKKPPKEKPAPNTEKLDLQTQLQQVSDQRDRLQEELDRATQDWEVRVAAAADEEIERRVKPLLGPIEEITGITDNPQLAIDTLLQERERMISELEELKNQREVA